MMFRNISWISKRHKLDDESKKDHNNKIDFERFLPKMKVLAIEKLRYMWVQNKSSTLQAKTNLHSNKKMILKR